MASGLECSRPLAYVCPTVLAAWCAMTCQVPHHSHLANKPACRWFGPRPPRRPCMTSAASSLSLFAHMHACMEQDTVLNCRTIAITVETLNNGANTYSVLISDTYTCYMQWKLQTRGAGWRRIDDAGKGTRNRHLPRAFPRSPPSGCHRHPRSHVVTVARGRW